MNNNNNMNINTPTIDMSKHFNWDILIIYLNKVEINILANMW